MAAGGDRPPAATVPLLEMRGITKRFGATLANDAIDLEIVRGEIHALLGENGAGKSTLMNVLYGLVAPDAGEVRVDGEPVTIADPSDAIARGIGMVHQHFMLVPVFTVAENVMLGQETTAAGGLLDVAATERRLAEHAAQLGFEIDPGAVVSQLSVGQQQRVEILKAIYRGARVLVLDEPTAVLTPQETQEIFGVLRRLRDEGTSIVFISHKLDEVLAIADRITVIRRGSVVGTRVPAGTSAAELAELMVGRAVSLHVQRGTASPGAVVLALDGLRVRDDRRHETVGGIDLQVRAGEIVGIAGVAGNGQDELVQAIVGLRRQSAGRVRLGEEDLTGRSPREIRERGVAYVPADRQRSGLVLGYSLVDDLVLTSYYRRPFARGPLNVLRDEAAAREHARGIIAEFDVRAPSELVRASTLSGGNQQKLVVGRELSGAVRLLILDQPTRGLDVGSIEFIHRRVVAARDAGAAVLLVSAELDEVLDLSDRVAVLYRGAIVGLFDAADARRERIGLLMARGSAA